MIDTTETGKLGGYVIYVPYGDMRDAVRKLKETGIIDIKEGRPRNPKDSIPLEIASWGAIKKLIDGGFIDEKTHNFIINPVSQKMEKNKKRCLCLS